MESAPARQLWLDVALTTLLAIYSTAKVIVLHSVQVVVYLFHLVTWPLSILLRLLLLVFAPVIYIGQLALAPFLYMINMIPRLQPLYIYFASAAFVGILAGLILQLSSRTIISTLGLQARDKHLRHPGPKYKLETTDSDSRPGTADSFSIPELSTGESDWQWLPERPPNPNVTRKRKSPGLSALTILEEGSDDSF